MNAKCVPISAYSLICPPPPPSCPVAEVESKLFPVTNPPSTRHRHFPILPQRSLPAVRALVPRHNPPPQCFFFLVVFFFLFFFVFWVLWCFFFFFGPYETLFSTGDPCCSQEALGPIVCSSPLLDVSRLNPVPPRRAG